MCRLFEICVKFLEWMGNTFHITYQQISVYINLYLQGGVLVLSTIPALIMAIAYKNPFWIAITTINTLSHSLGFAWMMMHYRLPTNINFAFNQCVDDLLLLAERWNLTYQQVNIVIFVIGFLLLLCINLGMCWIMKNQF